MPIRINYFVLKINVLKLNLFGAIQIFISELYQGGNVYLKCLVRKYTIPILLHFARKSSSTRTFTEGQKVAQMYFVL